MHALLLLGYLLLYVAVLTFLLPYLLRARQQGVTDAQHAVRADGRVLEVSRDLDHTGGQTSMHFRPRVAYWGPGGESLDSWAQDSGPRNPWQVGTVVPVWFDSRDPQRVWVRQPTTGGALGQLFGLLAVVTLLFVVFGFLLVINGVL